jgi:predicted Zn finger-like uncharacterized protein
MTFRVRCPGCQSSFACPQDQLGKRLRCTYCRKTFSVHAAGAPPVGEREADAALRPRRRRKPLGMWTVLGVGVISAFIIGGSFAIGISWYRTPSGPPRVAPNQSSSVPGVPSGYDQVTGR